MTKARTLTLGRIGYGTAVLLTTVGIYACLSRYLLPTDLHYQISLLLYGPTYTHEGLTAVASMPVNEFIHRIFGAIYLIIGLMQFNSNLRRKHIDLHRILGKILMVFSLTGAISGILFVLLIPFAGFVESIPIILFGCFMIYATYRAWVHIRRKEVRLHQEWITRSYAIGLGVSSIRVVFLGLCLTTEVDHHDLFVAAVWTGWVLTLGCVEIYNNISRDKSELAAAHSTI